MKEQQLAPRVFLAFNDFSLAGQRTQRRSSS